MIVNSGSIKSITLAITGIKFEWQEPTSGSTKHSKIVKINTARGSGGSSVQAKPQKSYFFHQHTSLKKPYILTVNMFLVIKNAFLSSQELVLL